MASTSSDNSESSSESRESLSESTNCSTDESECESRGSTKKQKGKRNKKTGIKWTEKKAVKERAREEEEKGKERDVIVDPKTGEEWKCGDTAPRIPPTEQAVVLEEGYHEVAMPKDIPKGVLPPIYAEQTRSK